MKKKILEDEENLLRQCSSATIRIDGEIQCLTYAAFLLLFVTAFMAGAVYVAVFISVTFLLLWIYFAAMPPPHIDDIGTYLGLV